MGRERPWCAGVAFGRWQKDPPTARNAARGEIGPMAGVGPVGAGGGAPLYLGRTEMMATILREEKPVEKAGREYFRFTQDMTDVLDMLDEAAIGQVVKAVGHRAFFGEEPGEFSDKMAEIAYRLMVVQAIDSLDAVRRAQRNGASGGRPRRQ